MLKIITDVISMTLAGRSFGEITYNLDGDYFPALSVALWVTPGLDPETSAKNGDDGSTEPSIKDLFHQQHVASPNFFDPIATRLTQQQELFPKQETVETGRQAAEEEKELNGAHARLWLRFGLSKSTVT